MGIPQLSSKALFLSIPLRGEKGTEMNRESLERGGELIFPVLAVGFSLYMLITQYLKDVRPTVFNYCLLLTIPIVITGLIAIIKFFVSTRKRESEEAGTVDQEGEVSCETAPVKLNYTKPLLVLFFSGLFVVLLPLLGFLIASFILIASLMPLMGARSLAGIAAVSVLVPLGLYLVFVVLIEMQFPVGIFGF